MKFKAFFPLRVMLCLFALLMAATAQALETERVVLLTVDGLRCTELFSGVDPLMLTDEEQSGIEDMEALKKAYWRDTAEARREALLPFFWGTMAKQGVVVGNPEKNSHVRVENPHRVSYPGYAEILTGAPQLRILGNQRRYNVQTTVLEFVQQERKLGYTDVAAFCSWDVFNWVCARAKDPFYINAGYEAVPEKLLAPGMEPLNTLQFEMMTPWNSVRFDRVTADLGMAFLKQYEPTLFYLALGETDDWGHNRRYDRVIHAARLFDTVLEELWTTLQSMDAYRDKTTLIITTDHGRGVTLEDWTSHKFTIPGSEDIWMAVFGPDTPDRGELSDTQDYTQGQVAPTIARLLGHDLEAFYPESRPPLAVAFSE